LIGKYSIRTNRKEEKRTKKNQENFFNLHTDDKKKERKMNNYSSWMSVCLSVCQFVYIGKKRNSHREKNRMEFLSSQIRWSIQMKIMNII